MTSKFEYAALKPLELSFALKRRPIAYLGLGPLEWHGEHLPFGTDPIRAHAVMTKVWRKAGGVLLPPLFVGTDGHKRIDGIDRWGMEMFARTRLPGSLYVSEKAFKLLMRDTVDALEKQGFKLAVLFTGHEAPDQVKTLMDLEKRSRRRRMKVLACWARRGGRAPGLKPPKEDTHAGPGETAEMLSVAPGWVGRGRAGKLRRDRSVGLTKKNLSQPQVRAAYGRAQQAAQARWILGRIKGLKV